MRHLPEMMQMTELRPAAPTVPGDVIDAHCHLFSLGLLQEYRGEEPRPERQRFQKASRTSGSAGEASSCPR